MNKAEEEIFDKYSERLTVAYESAGQGTVKHSNEVLTKERFLKAIEEFAQQFRSQPETEKRKLILECLEKYEGNGHNVVAEQIEIALRSQPSQQSNTVPTEWPTRFEIADMIYDGVEKGEDPSKIAEEILSRMLSSSPSAKEEEPMQIMTSSEWLKAKAENEKEEAIGFAEWIRHNGWVGTDGYWYQQGRKMHGLTTAELFSVYQQSKTKNT